jgi:hypothetical protein
MILRPPEYWDHRAWPISLVKHVIYDLELSMLRTSSIIPV